MTLVLNTIPGFADLSDTPLGHDRAALGLLLAKISDNAAFGVVRLEIFAGVYSNGQTVDLPTSPIDGYVYSRAELNYLWAPQATGDVKSNWASAGPPWTMWYAAYKVDQATGLVSCETGYRGNSDHKDRQMKTNDGVLSVWVIAQRQRSTLSLAAVPSFVAQPSSAFATDKALTELMLRDLNGSAKAGVVNQEMIYMGEFKNGDTVAAPVSPADGYAYSLGEVSFMTSTRWTMDDDGASPPTASAPAIAKGQLKGWAFSVNATTGVVTTHVTYENSGATTYNTGRVAVFAFCQRLTRRISQFVDAKHGPWNAGLPGNAAFPYGNGTQLGPYVLLPGLAAGDTVIITATGLASYLGGGTFGPAGDGTTYTGLGSSGTYFPAHWVTPVPPAGLPGLMGAFTDAGGNVIKAIWIGVGGSFVVPAGATQLQLGCNDDVYNDNGGGYTAVVAVQPALVLGGVSPFVEIDDAVFFPGEPLRASTMLQLETNAEVAFSTPEVFGPTNRSNGDTVALPVSPIDGYTYARSELQYLWDFVDTSTAEPDNGRIVFLHVAIDEASGAVSIDAYRASSSSDGAFLSHNGTLRVVTFAKRDTSQTHPAVAAVAPATGGGISTDDPGGGEITVNGV